MILWWCANRHQSDRPAPRRSQASRLRRQISRVPVRARRRSSLTALAVSHSRRALEARASNASRSRSRVEILRASIGIERRGPAEVARAVRTAGQQLRFNPSIRHSRFRRDGAHLAHNLPHGSRFALIQIKHPPARALRPPTLAEGSACHGDGRASRQCKADQQQGDPALQQQLVPPAARGCGSYASSCQS
jgi:hypothetical protein